jgi:undecaprenyl-diphosphatase
MQEDILYFFQKIAHPGLDLFFNTMSFVAEQYLFIAIFSLIYWNVSKKEGFALTFTFLLSSLANELLKLLFRTPRPFQVLESINGKRLSTATGYAFPSGHTQGATTFYISLAAWFKKPWFWVLAFIISFLVGISRLYLGVHWPIDVLGGWFLGLLFAIWVYRHILIAIEKPRVFNWMVGIVVVVSMLILGYLLYLRNVKGIAIQLENYLRISAIIMGSLAGYLIEIKLFNYQTQSTKLHKWIRYLVGLIGSLGIIGGLKFVFPDGDWFVFVRYLLAGFWISFLFPTLGIWLGWFAKTGQHN